MVRSDPSLRAFSTAVAAIYDCALDPAYWKEALRLIAELTDSPCASMGTMDYTQGRLANGVFFGIEPTYVTAYFEKFAVNPLISAGHMRPVGEVYRHADIISDEVFDSRFYHDWANPQDLRDLIAVNAVRSVQRVGALCIIRKGSQPRYAELHLHTFRLLAPHICRAFAISDALDLRTVTSQRLEATLDALTTGVYLADRNGRLVYMNPAAGQQIRAGNTLLIIDNRLAPRNGSARSMMSRAIAEATTNESAMPVGGITLALPDGQRGGLVATILPLNQGRRRGLSGPFAATAAIFVQDPVVSPHYPGEAFGKLYGLTNAELRVLLAMAPGLVVKDVAAILRIGEVTARTHLQHIYSKTGTSKQTELLNLLNNSSPPIAAI
jgi:DNA-binding CsgD family transcriptional regulator/PAS domain-containing protein